MRFRPHCPSFINDGKAREGPTEFSSLDDLKRIPQVSRFTDDRAELYIEAYPDEDLLVGVFPDDSRLVVGYLETGHGLALPPLKPGRV